MRVTKRILAGLVLALVAITGVADVGEAKITIRRHAATDAFFFHGNYSSQPFDPRDHFALEIWNCANGAVPVLIADRDPFVICGYDAASGYAYGDLVYAVDVPGGTCVDHGRSCYYRRHDGADTDGVSYFRVRYARRGHGNRVWLESSGDLSAADQASMLIIIKTNGAPRATLQDVFTPLPNGGWFSAY